MSDAQVYKDFGQKYAEAWSSQLPEEVAGMFSPTGFITINGSQPAIGRIAIVEVAQEYMSAFPDLDVRCTNLVVKTNAIQWSWRMKGTNSGPGGSGRAIDIEGYETIVLDASGLIASAHGYFDEDDFNRQLN